MNEETTQKVITHLLDEVKRVTTERNTAIKDLEKVLDNFEDVATKYEALYKQYSYLDATCNFVMSQYKALYENYNDLAGKMPNNKSKKYKPMEPSLLSMISQL